MLDVKLTLVSAATSDAIVARQYAGLLQGFRIDDVDGLPFGMEQSLKGALLRTVMALVNREVPTKHDAAGIAANSNTTNTIVFRLWLPFHQPALGDPYLLCPPAYRLRKAEVRWCGATQFGTGQVITAATTYARLYAITQAKAALSPVGELVYVERPVSQFSREIVPLRGSTLFLALADLAAGAATTIGATDFTYSEIVSQEHLGHGRLEIDVPTKEYNGVGNPNAAVLALPTAGTSDFALQFVHPWGASLGDCPNERDVEVTLEVGAGAPALADQSFLYAVVRPADIQRQARAFGAASEFHSSADRFIAAYNASKSVRGNSGIIPAGTAGRMAGKLRTKLDPKILLGR